MPPVFIDGWSGTAAKAVLSYIASCPKNQGEGRNVV
jgi:hypothetical protein